MGTTFYTGCESAGVLRTPPCWGLGLFSVLLARYENPHKNLILSGISIKTNSGNKFYGAKGHPNRMFVDKSAFIKIKKRFTKNLYTTDETTAKFCKIPLIKKKF